MPACQLGVLEFEVGVASIQTAPVGSSPSSVQSGAASSGKLAMEDEAAAPLVRSGSSSRANLDDPPRTLRRESSETEESAAETIALETKAAFEAADR